MGAFRLVLSLLVVASHVGGMGDTQAGGTAVASFFAISGFLMARTIAENYRGSGFGRFYLNRVIRLAPPLLAVILLTSLALWARDSRGFQIKQDSERLYMPVDFPPSPASLVTLNASGFPNYIRPQFYLVPQAWSLIVEAGFYLVAPILVLVVERKALSLVWIVAAVSFVLAAESTRLHLDWLRSPFATLWIFVLGMQAYFAARDNRWRLVKGSLDRRWAAAPLVLVVAMAMIEGNKLSYLALILAPLFVVYWLILGEWHVRRGDKLDQTLGNLSYGVFLGHFLGAVSMYWVAEAIYRSTGIFGVFGTPDDAVLFLWSYIFALATGIAIYYGVERPLDKIRRNVRKGSARSSVPAAGVLSSAS